MNRFTSFALAIAASLAVNAAWAAPQMTSQLKAEKDVVVVENGKQVKKRVEAKEFQSGDVIIYTDAYANVGKEPVTNATIDALIPQGTTYVPDSAKGNGELQFSADGGKTYKKPSQLTVDSTGKDGKKTSVPAKPDNYTNIRWLLPQVPSGTSGTTSYQVRVK